MTIDARIAHYTAVSLAVDLASCIDLYYEYQDTDLAAAILAGDAITMIPVLPSMGALHGFAPSNRRGYGGKQPFGKP